MSYIQRTAFYTGSVVLAAAILGTPIGFTGSLVYGALLGINKHPSNANDYKTQADIDNAVNGVVSHFFIACPVAWLLISGITFGATMYLGITAIAVRLAIHVVGNAVAPFFSGRQAADGAV